MKEHDATHPGRRQDRLLREHIHDTYKRRQKLPEPSRCPQCGAVYRDGRWAWAEVVPADAQDERCPACQRTNDKYPAGELILRGSFVKARREEIVRIARNAEQAEKGEHPLNRIMTIEEREDGMVITTTDVHLPHRIGHTLHHTWNGDLDVHYDEEGYFVRVEWRCDG